MSVVEGPALITTCLESLYNGNVAPGRLLLSLDAATYIKRYCTVYQTQLGSFAACFPDPFNRMKIVKPAIKSKKGGDRNATLRGRSTEDQR